MKNILQTTALLSALTTCVLGAADLINGNWYGQAVDRIIYDGWDSSGTYNEVVDMSNGQCKMQPTTFSGSLSPLNEEVSWHFRGPMHLKQFAFYTPGSSSKRSLRPTPQQRRHVHGHAEKAVGDWVTATINGNVVSWINEYAGVPTSSPTTSASSSILLASSTSALTTTTPSATLPSPSALAAPALNAGAGNWGRQAYYNAANGTADGLVFLNNMGGQESGVFDMTFGNSLSYAAANALSGSATPQVLADTLIPDNNEIIIYTDQQCQGNDCGYYRPGSVAYHGFAGDSKLFLMEFDMPLSGKTGWNMDMPAAWMLNAKIARTQQYGNCSCWASGCGEWDVLEGLDPGNTRLKSTLHAGPQSGGSSDYFTRPTNQTMKAAVIFDASNSAGHIVVLPDDTTFDAIISDQLLSSLDDSSLIKLSTKVFKVGSAVS